MPQRFRRLAIATAGALALVAGLGAARVATRADLGGPAPAAAAPADRYAVAGTWTAVKATFAPMRGEYTGVLTVTARRRVPGCFGVSGTVTYTVRDAAGRWLGRIVAPGGEICLHGRPGARTHSLRSDCGRHGPLRGEGRFVPMNP